MCAVRRADGGTKLWAASAHSTNWMTRTPEKYAKRLRVTELSHAKRNSIVAVALAALNVWPSEAETIDIIDDHGGLTHQLIWTRTPEVYRFFASVRRSAARYSSFSVVK
jgi:hypothetical protein